MTPFLQHNSKRLANTLETKEVEFQMKEEEYQSDLQMKDHFDAGLEIKVLDCSSIIRLYQSWRKALEYYHV